MFAVAEATLFGAAAALSAVVGVVLSVFGWISGRRNAAETAAKECHEQLLAARAESEQLSSELHKLRMRHDEST